MLSIERQSIGENLDILIDGLLKAAGVLCLIESGLVIWLNKGSQTISDYVLQNVDRERNHDSVIRRLRVFAKSIGTTTSASENQKTGANLLLTAVEGLHKGLLIALEKIINESTQETEAVEKRAVVLNCLLATASQLGGEDISQILAGAPAPATLPSLSALIDLLEPPGEENTDALKDMVVYKKIRLEQFPMIGITPKLTLVVCSILAALNFLEKSGSPAA